MPTNHMTPILFLALLVAYLVAHSEVPPVRLVSTANPRNYGPGTPSLPSCLFSTFLRDMGQNH